MGASLLFLGFICLPPVLNSGFWVDYKGPKWMTLDASWMIAINQAISQKLTWGEEFIFTYGPLGYYPTRFTMAYGKWALLSIDFFVIANLLFAFYYFLKRNGSIWNVLIIAVVMLNASNFFDDRIVAMALALNMFWLYHFLTHKQFYALVMASLLSVFIFYTKLNLGFVGYFFSVIAIALSLYLKQIKWERALLAFFVFLLPALLLAMILQVSLMSYIKGGLELVSGYNQTMQLKVQRGIHIIFAVLCIVLTGILLGYAWVKKSKLSQQYLLGSLLLILLLLYKQGFVRGDLPHSYDFIALFAPFVLAVVPFLDQNLRIILRIPFLILLAIAFGITIERGQLHPPKPYAQTRMANYLGRMPKSNYLIDYPSLSDRRLPDSLLTMMAGKTVDIIPWDVALLYSSGVNYRPRPVPQSYVTYTGNLDKKNAEHFCSDRAPDFLLINHYAIDERYFFWDNPMTIQSVLDNYEFVADYTDGFNPYLVLRKKPTVRKRITGGVLKDTTILFANYLRVGDLGPDEKISFDFSYSLLGRLSAVFFQAPIVVYELGFDNERKVFHRAVPPILKAGVPMRNYMLDTGDIKNNLTGVDTTGKNHIQFITFYSETPKLFRPQIKVRIQKNEWER